MAQRGRGREGQGSQERRGLRQLGIGRALRPPRAPPPRPGPSALLVPDPKPPHLPSASCLCSLARRAQP